MTSQRANAIYDLGNDAAARMIDAAVAMRPGLKRPGVRSFKTVLAYIGHRDRPRNKDKSEHYCDDSLEQIADALGFGGDNRKSAAVADVVALATEIGILKTVRAGGRNTPTRRTIDLAKLAELSTVATVVIASDSNGEHHANRLDTYGEYADTYGENANSNGVSTATPIEPKDLPKVDHPRTAPDGAAVRDDLTKSGQRCDGCDRPGLVECVSGWIGAQNNGGKTMRCPHLLAAIETQNHTQKKMG